MSDCVFCRIAAHELPADIVREDDDLVAFRDLQPQAPLHVLVIPKRHIASLAESTDPVLVGRLMLAAVSVAQADPRARGGFRVLTNIGSDAGQTVLHLHFHVLAGREETRSPQGLW